MAARSEERKYNRVLVLGPSAAEIDGSDALPQVARARVDRGFEDFYGADFNRDEGLILVAGEHCGTLNVEGQIDREESSLAAYALSQYIDKIPGGDDARSGALLLGVDSADIEQVLKQSKKRHRKFFGSLRNSGEILKVVADKKQFEDVLKFGGKILDCYASQFVRSAPRVPLVNKSDKAGKVIPLPPPIIVAASSAADE